MRTLLWSLAAAVLYALCALVLAGSTSDDAYIFSRYAKNLLAHGDVVWNPGEARVEGFTSWAWLLVHALGLWLDLHPVGFARFVGAALGSLAAGLVVRQLLRAAPPAAALVYGSWVVISPDGWLYASSGMDAPLWVLSAWLWLLWFARGERLRVAHVAAAGALLLVRPEAVLLLGLCALRAGLEAATGRARPVEAARALVLGGLVPAALFGARLALFGSLVSNSVAAKHLGGSPLARLLDGLLYLAEEGGPYLVPAGIALAASLAAGAHFPPWRAALGDREARTTWTMAAFAALTLAFVAVAGGDDRSAFPHARLLLPALGPMAYALARLWPATAPRAALLAVATLALAQLPAAKERLRAAAGATNMTSARAVLASLWAGVAPASSPLSQFFLRATPPGERIALPWAGRVPYETGLPTLDLLGLNDPHIASLPPLQRGIDVKYDPDYVLAQKPYFLCEAVSLWRPTAEIVRMTEADLYAAGAWKVGQRRLFSDPRFATLYELEPSAPVRGMGTCFRRRR